MEILDLIEKDDMQSNVNIQGNLSLGMKSHLNLEVDVYFIY